MNAVAAPARSEPEAGRVCALILCGGRSSRMGFDKAALPFYGQTLLERAADFWTAQPGVAAVLAAVGGPERALPVPAGVTPVYDAFPDAGPMAGLHAGLLQLGSDADALYVSAVDMPFLTPGLLPPLPEGDACVYVKDGRPEPLLGAYRRSCLPALESALRHGQRKMTALLDAVDTAYLPLPEALAAAAENLNTHADYLRAIAGAPPTVACMGWSGSGKTTFLEKLLPALTARGLRVAVVKRDAHGIRMDTPGKDTWRLARAGAVCTAIMGPEGWAVLGREEIELDGLRAKLPPSDLVLIEGHKYGPYPKLEVHRRETGKPFLTADATLLAAITDEPLPTAAPQLGLDDAEPCADLLMEIFFPGEGKKAGKYTTGL